ncbi:ABC transporter permease [Otariodibacter oris]|uniref:Iron complex transport system permease protein n=1 Tax=Otariodibacter oris TaxID=1032623 RepID=A0A420XGW3_9PAST|nr:iron chelate uptake ABC transporter family permease subunit [Otariodibacter oris]QGM81637.1 iron ABC transporter permease [Otariodibacter oris]RKR71894.1 iron complex transport system permease protein [Otariodibacter oris]
MYSIITLFVLLVILSISSLFIGVSNVDIVSLFHFDPEQWNIVTLSRIPRLISLLIAGASLSVCGLIMQQISQNRFVSPTIVGTMDSARLGILLSIILFPNVAILGKTVFATIVAFFGSLLFILILRHVKFKNMIFVPLVGIMMGNIISSITLFIAIKLDILQNLSGWLQGDFSLIMQGRYELLYLGLPILVIIYFFISRFAIVGMGKDIAKMLGLNYQGTLYFGLFIVSIITSIILVTIGMIPFIGLIIPNLITLYYGDNLSKILPLTAILGALFIIVCDVFGRLIIYPYEVPINTTVGVLGSGIFLFILAKRYRNNA